MGSVSTVARLWLRATTDFMNAVTQKLSWYSIINLSPKGLFSHISSGSMYFGKMRRSQCRDPSSWEHVSRTSWWHVARATIRITLIRIHVTCLSYPDHLKEVRTTLINKRHPDDFHLISGPPQGSSNDACKHRISGRLPRYIRMTNIVHPDIMVRIIDWSKQVSHVITTACQGPRSTTCRVKGQDEVTTSHFPRPLHMITCHDLWQPHHLPRSLSKLPVGWWWPCHHLVSSWQHKIFPHH